MRWRSVVGGVFFLLLVNMVSAEAAGQSGVWLGAKRVESRLIEIAVPDFRMNRSSGENYGALASRIISADLKFSGYFKVNEDFSYLRQVAQKEGASGTINFEEWRTLSSNFLVKGKVEVGSGNRITLRLTLHDLQSRARIYSKSLSGEKGEFRLLVHRASDSILSRVAGEEGIATSRIAFVSRLRRSKEIFLMDYDGNRPHPVTDDRRLALFPHWNPTKDQILFTTYRYRNPDLYMLDLKSRSRTAVSRRIGLNATGEWSPDGRKIAFSFSRRGNSDIYIINADGSNMQQITTSHAIETSPTWSPDSKFIAYTSDRPGTPQIYVMRTDGREARRISYSGRYNDGATWSPRGDYIAYTSLMGRYFDIALIEAKNIHEKRRREVRQLTFGPGSNEAPSFSPNGRHIAFSVTRGGKKQIAIMNTTGGNMTQVTHLGGGGYLPSWGPVRH